MLPPTNPKAGETYTAYDFEWTWVPPHEIERGHWLANDDTRVKIYPASQGVDELRVCVPTGPTSEIEDMVVHLRPHDYDEAFRYAAGERKARAN